MKQGSFAYLENLETPEEPQDDLIPDGMSLLEAAELVVRGKLRLSPQRVRTLIEVLKITEPKRRAVDHKSKGDLAVELDRLDKARARSNKARIFQLEDLRGRRHDHDDGQP